MANVATPLGKLSAAAVNVPESPIVEIVAVAGRFTGCRLSV
jgi:hypothetical protein